MKNDHFNEDFSDFNTTMYMVFWQIEFLESRNEVNPIDNISRKFYDFKIQIQFAMKNIYSQAFTKGI